MKPQRKLINAKWMIGVAAAVSVAAAADIPGMFVTQQVNVADPVLTSSVSTTLTSSFGGGDIRSIGMIDDAEYFVTGAKQSYNDSGSLILLKKGSGVSLNMVAVYSAREPIFKDLLNTYEDFGEGIAVVSKASPANLGCAKMVVSATQSGKLWGLTLCKDAGSIPKLTVSSMIDSTKDAALKGLPFLSGSIGSSMAVIDTIALTNEVVIALGVPSAKRILPNQTKVSSGVGSVIIMAVNPGTTWTWRRLSVLPSSLDATDTLSSAVALNSNFGASLAALRGSDGSKILAVLSPGDKVASSPVGQVHLVGLDENWKAKSHTVLVGTANVGKTSMPYSLSSADFNHDGISDLVVGYKLAPGPSSEAAMGGFAVNILDSKWTISDSKLFMPLSNGVTAPVELQANSRLGARVEAVDLDRDGQLEVIAGAEGVLSTGGNPRVPGSLWVFRMKNAPWLHKPAGTIGLSQKQMVSTLISDYLTGNDLTCSANVTTTTPPLVSCSFGKNPQAQYSLDCSDLGLNGTTTVRVICSDHGNVPATDSISDTLDFVLSISKGDSLPQVVSALPSLVLREDQPDTVVLTFSSYFRDPEAKALEYKLERIGVATPLLDTFYVDKATGKLHLKAIPLRFGPTSIKVTVTDAAGGYLVDTLEIQINHVNHPPVAVVDSATAKEATSTTINVMGNDVDPDKDPMTISVGTRSIHGKTSVVNGALFYTPDSFYVGSDSIMYELKDSKNATATAMVRIKVASAASLPRVVRPLPPLVVVKESSDTIRISYDSLFYSGEYGFNVPVYDRPINTCDLRGGIAGISLDLVARKLIIAPWKYKNGECQIILRSSATPFPDSVASGMTLRIESVENPYHFAKDTVDTTAIKGEKTVYPLVDVMDNDQDSLEYYLLDPAPAWASVERGGLAFTPGAKDGDAMVSLAVRKKAKVGKPVNQATDTLVLNVFATRTSSIHGRKLGNLVMDYRAFNRTLMIQGGKSAYEVRLYQLDGRQLGALRGESGEVSSFVFPGKPGMLYLRIIEGDRRFTSPLLLNP